MYRRPAPTWLAIRSLVVRDLASAAVLVMWDRLVFHRYSSGTSSLQGASLLAAALAHSSARNPVVCGDPADGNIVTSAQDASTNLYGCHGEALAGADGVGLHPIDGYRVRKDHVAMAALLPSADGAKSLINGVDLCVKGLLSTEVEASASPLARTLPYTCRFHLTAVQARAVRADRVSASASPLVGGLEGSRSLLNHDPAREMAAAPYSCTSTVSPGRRAAAALGGVVRVARVLGTGFE